MLTLPHDTVNTEVNGASAPSNYVDLASAPGCRRRGSAPMIAGGDRPSTNGAWMNQFDAPRSFHQHRDFSAFAVRGHLDGV